MFSCCCHAQAAGGLFSRFAKYYRHRYRWLGLEPSQRQLVQGLSKVGYQGASLLEIGCGVGYLHQWLVKHGAAKAVGVDLSAGMLQEAWELAAEQGLDSKVSYRQGDYTELARDLASADIVILDKVICCYPDVDTLLASASENANRVIALTYPRIHLLTRMGMGLLNRLLALSGSHFRTYLHRPDHVQKQLSSLGWDKAYEASTTMWLSQIYLARSALID